jgi:hypothetical protein
MKRIVVFGLLLFTAGPVTAEFSPAEKAELLKVFVVRQNIGALASRVGSSYARFGTAENKTAFHTVFERLHKSFVDCSVALSHFSNSTHSSSPRFVLPTRQDYVDIALRSVDQCRFTLSTVVPRAQQLAISTGSDLNGAVQLAQQLVALLTSFDSSLSYHDFELPEFPSVAPPHGDMPLGVLFHLSRSSLYLEQTWQMANKTLLEADVVPQTARASWRSAMGSMKLALSTHSRIWAMDFNVFLPGDLQKIQVRRAAGNNLRPISFWRVDFQLELLLSRGGNRFPLLSSGMPVESGFGAALTGLGRHFADFGKELVRANASDPAEVARLSSPLLELFADLTDAWGDSDGTGEGYIGLFHGFPSGPPGCPEGETCQPPCSTFVSTTTVTGAERPFVGVEAQCAESESP